MKVDYIKLVDLFPQELDAQFSKLYLPPHNAVRIVISQNKQILSVSKLKHFQRRALQLLSCEPQSRCPHIPRVCSGSPYVPVDFSRCASYGSAFLTLTKQCDSEEDEVASSCPQCEAHYLYTEFCRMICAESPVRGSRRKKIRAELPIKWLRVRGAGSILSEATFLLEKFLQILDGGRRFR